MLFQQLFTDKFFSIFYFSITQNTGYLTFIYLILPFYSIFHLVIIFLSSLDLFNSLNKFIFNKLFILDRQ